jgi:hypothetical protein
MAGEPMAGEPMAGEPMAGEPMAGEHCTLKHFVIDRAALVVRWLLTLTNPAPIYRGGAGMVPGRRN